MAQTSQADSPLIEPGADAWANLTPDEKMERRFAAWLEPATITFASPEAAADYKARATRIMNALRLDKTPDRVPVMSSLGGLAAEYCGYTERDMLYDADKAAETALRTTLEFQADSKGSGLSFSGRALEILDWKMHHWPGHGIGENVGWQFIEGEYLKATEYRALVDDPSDYWLRTFLPRVMGALEPLGQLAPLTHFNSVTNIPTQLSRFGLLEVRQALEKLMEAGEVMLDWQQKMGAANRKLDELGFPGTSSGMAMAPFDTVGDGMRGTVGIISDLFRRPDKILAAIEKITPVIIERAVAGARLGGCPVVTLPLHKGADGFMSDSQFREFYWPSLKAVVEGLNREGLMARMFAEGGYNTRLEVIREVPMGKTAWYFDQTDMARAREALGGVASIQGNVPVSLIHTGTPEAVYEHCKHLIDVVGEGGGYILSTGASVGRGGRVENIRAMIRCAKEYGVY